MDKAFRLVHMLRDHGEVRLRAAAEELGVAESTVHRLMAMLVFHGFARQEDSRAYIPGHALGASPVHASWTRSLRDIAVPYLDELSKETGETVNVVVRAGTKARFLWSREGERVLRIVPRIGVVIPAATSAAGRALLADLSIESLLRLYQGPQAQDEAMSDGEFDAFVHKLRLFRRNGHATADQETEVGVSAIAMPIHDEADHAIAAVSIASPSVRYADLLTKKTMGALARARDSIEGELHGLPPAE